MILHFPKTVYTEYVSTEERFHVHRDKSGRLTFYIAASLNEQERKHARSDALKKHRRFPRIALPLGGSLAAMARWLRRSARHAGHAPAGTGTVPWIIGVGAVSGFLIIHAATGHGGHPSLSLPGSISNPLAPVAASSPGGSHPAPQEHHGHAALPRIIVLPNHQAPQPSGRRAPSLRVPPPRKIPSPHATPSVQPVPPSHKTPAPRVSPPSLPVPSVPGVPAPRPTLPSLPVPKVTVPSVPLPKVTLPPLPKVTLPALPTPTVSIPVPVPSVSTPPLPTAIPSPPVTLPPIPPVPSPPVSTPPLPGTGGAAAEGTGHTHHGQLSGHHRARRLDAATAEKVWAMNLL